MVTKANKNTELYCCDLCNKTYKTERGLLNHKCRSRLRLQEYQTNYGRIAFICYDLFYKKLHFNSYKKNGVSLTNFINSEYYNGFIKIGKYIVDNKIPNYKNYVNFLINYNVKLEKWTSDEVYNAYVKTCNKTENPETAVEKSLKTMLQWANNTRKPWQNYFNEEDKTRILHCVKTGRISPWVLYNSETGKMFLSKLDSHDFNLVYDLMDPKYWNIKFKRQSDHTKAVCETLKQAGL